ncbi:hypothetical protein Hanom_Chr04g00318221 [Helianthus anomalus]
MLKYIRKGRVLMERMCVIVLTVKRRQQQKTEDRRLMGHDEEHSLPSSSSSERRVVDAIKKILYVDEVDASIVEEGQAMLLHQEKPIVDVEEYKTQKRKSIINLDVDVATSDIDVYIYICTQM